MNPLEMLAPNSLSISMMNSGVEMMTANMGWGISELKQGSTGSTESKDNTGMADIRRAKAREFGRPAQDVGF